jgi:hypothetical protein
VPAEDAKDLFLVLARDDRNASDLFGSQLKQRFPEVLVRNGRDGRPRGGGKHRGHADNHIGSDGSRNVGKETVGEGSEGGPKHGAEKQGGGKHPPASPAPDRYGGGQNLETEKDQRGAQDDLALGGTFQGVIPDTEEVRVIETEGSNAQPPNDGFDPLGNLQALEAVFKEIRGPTISPPTEGTRTT